MLEIIVQDITTLDVDVIVNAANSRLAGGGGVDGAIHRAAGPELASACQSLGGCPVGEVRLTPGFRLPARYIIHTVGPVWAGGKQGEARALASCYRNALQMAYERKLTSIAFPAISTGVYGYPKAAATAIALAQMQAFRGKLDRIVACCFADADARLYQQYLQSNR